MNTNYRHDDGQIKQSWQRCAEQYKIDPYANFNQELLTGSEIAHYRGESEELIHVSQPIIHRLRKVAKDAGYCVLFANSNGVVIDNHSDCLRAERLADQGLSIGSIWQESRAGTNGIGTSIASRQPVTVVGEEHFYKQFRKYICSAAPVFSGDGKILGSIDISGLTPKSLSIRSFVQHLILDTSQQIQSIMFRRKYEGLLILALQNSAHVIHPDMTALIAVDQNGLIKGATTKAVDQLAFRSQTSMINQKAERLLGAELTKLESAIIAPVRVMSGTALECHVLALPSPQNNHSRNLISQEERQNKNREKIKKSILAKACKNYTLDQLSQNDPTMNRVIGLCRKFIDRDLPILLQGETGVGKEVFAKALHNESQRSPAPFIAVNCAAIPDSLLDSELFGYAPGTFTGGLKNGKDGKIVAANGGTLFLDEIGDMPQELQARLLRVLAEREVIPLGAIEPVPVDIKLVCATHRDLAELVESGGFREDLYYRINGAKLTIPPLRQRQNLRAIVQNLIAEEVDEPVKFSEAAWHILEHFEWPGNIRQLKNVIMFSLYACENNSIETINLPEEILQSVNDKSKTELNGCSVQAASRLISLPSLKKVAVSAERERILEVLKSSKWCVSKAARILDVSRATMHRRIKDFGIVRPDLRQ